MMKTPMLIQEEGGIFDELLARLTLTSHGFEYVVPGAHEDGIGNS